MIYVLLTARLRMPTQTMLPTDVYELFNVYSEWHDGRGGVPYGMVKQLLKEFDLLEGIPSDLVDAYVRENMVRADQDQDGLLSCQEFMLWLFGEVCALLPFKRNGKAYRPDDHRDARVTPLYNQFVYHSQRWRPDKPNDPRYRKCLGMKSNEFQALAQDLGWRDDRNVRVSGIGIAKQKATSERTQGQMEGGTRMQFVQFINALREVAVKKREGLNDVIYRVVGDGTAPPVIRSQSSNRAYRMALLGPAVTDLIEGSTRPQLMWTSVACERCGQEHSLWVGTDPCVHFPDSHTSRRPVNARHINTRNVRAAFHRYCLKHNKGLMPPSPPPAQPAPTARAPDRGSGSGDEGDRGGDDVGKRWGGGNITDLHSESDEEEQQGGGNTHQHSGAQWRTSDPDPWGAGGWEHCCCMYKQLSLMELQTWMKLCMDNGYIWGALRARAHKSRYPEAGYQPLTTERLEAAFLTACSIGSCYCSDTSCGIHDKPIEAGSARPVAVRGAMGPKQYGTPFDGAATKAATFSHRAGSARGTGALSTTLSTLRPSSAVVGPSASGTQFSTATIKAAGPVGKRCLQHRPATPTLNFPQFLEALRLVAEDIKGHPQNLPWVEGNLSWILHDLVVPGCPLEMWQSLGTSCAMETLGGTKYGATTQYTRQVANNQSPGEDGAARTWSPR